MKDQAQPTDTPNDAHGHAASTPERKMSKRWNPEALPDQTGKVAIVTGANSGIGFPTAQILVHKGAHVILACRNPDKGQEAVDRIEAEGASGTAELMVLDLSDLASVRAFAAAFKERFDRLDMLINNAGVMVPPYGKTADGFELQFGTNHLGHFALTGLLIDLVRATPSSRIVNVSSLAHRMGKINFADLHSEKKYRKWKAYGQSKLANMLFTFELQRRLEAAGNGTIATAAHPGYTATNLQANSRSARMGNALFAQKPEGGAMPTLYAAAAPEVAGGDYYGPRGAFELKGSPKRAKVSKRARDPEVAAQLWQVSEELTGVSFLS